MAGRTFDICERDESGWRVPNEGTASRKIYDLTKQGKLPKEISDILKMSRTDICRLKHLFKWADRTREHRKKCDDIMTEAA